MSLTNKSYFYNDISLVNTEVYDGSADFILTSLAIASSSATSFGVYIQDSDASNNYYLITSATLDADGSEVLDMRSIFIPEGYTLHVLGGTTSDEINVVVSGVEVDS